MSRGESPFPKNKGVDMTEYIDLLMMPAPRDLSADDGRGYDHEDMEDYATAAVLFDRAARSTVQPTSDVRACKYPDCVDNGQEGKCMDWMTGACPGPGDDLP